MGLLRPLILAAAGSTWLRQQAPRYSFIRRAVKRFMPGERVEDALSAADALQVRGISTILTHLGENLESLDEAEDVVRHYLSLLDLIYARKLDADVSVKLTQLGLDLDEASCHRHLKTLLDKAAVMGTMIWIDMESSAYTERTLDHFRRLKSSYKNVGVAIQAYLRRTQSDLASLMPLDPAIRVVKGAYLEPREKAFTDKKEVDEEFFRLSSQLLDAARAGRDAFVTIATHDLTLIERLLEKIPPKSAGKPRYEFAMLYGIQRNAQQRLAQDGHPVRVLISYGEFWFPWFMRRLAERPANILFLLKNLVSR